MFKAINKIITKESIKMNELVCCSIYDKLSEAFMRPFFTANIESAKRIFVMTCMNEESIIHQFPEDYDMYLIDNFLSKEGKFKGMFPKGPVKIMTGFEVRQYLRDKKERSVKNEISDET